VLDRPPIDDGFVQPCAPVLKRGARRRGDPGVGSRVELGAIGPDTRRGKRFGHIGQGSVICFPTNTVFNEHYIHIGAGTMFGPQITLSAGMVPGQQMVSDPVISIGDRCLIGKGSGIVGHLQIVIGDDVWTGHHVYITDQNHGYSDPGSADLQTGDARAPCRSGTVRGWATAPSCCLERRSDATSSSAPTAWSPDPSPTTAWRQACRHA
jgi:acetyltransferase-like isoleucine patch superfamily enzyme